MGCVSGVGRVVLVVLNLLFLIISLAILAVGVVLKFFAHEILNLLGNFSAVDLSTLKGVGVPDLKDVSNIPFLDEIGTALIVFGCFLLVVSFCACCGACCQFRPLLIVFVVLMIVLVLTQAVVGGLFIAKDSVLHDTIKEKLGERIKDEYDDTKDTEDAFSLAINVMNYMLECCGINGNADFGDKPVMSCCKKTVLSSSTASCMTPKIGDDFNDQGCYSKLQDEIVSKEAVAGVVLGLLLLLQVVEIVFAIIIVKDASSVGPV